MTRENPEAVLRDDDRIIERLWAADTSLWTADHTARELIRNRLGWLTAPDWLRAHLPELRDRMDEILALDWKRVVLLGMGGSSLAPKMLSQIFRASAPGLELEVLDSTHPEIVRRVAEAIDPTKTLFIVSSKSGTTIEVMALLAYFDGLLRAVKAKDRWQNFIAITDSGTPLERLAKEQNFRDCFVSPSDVGGRFSAFTYFGMVPAALLGLDLERLLDSAEQQVAACRTIEPENNSALLFGLRLAAHAMRGRNKLTLLLSSSIEPLGIWIEQLLAESTGKEGRGIVPVVNEPLLLPQQYGNDRIFAAVITKEDDALVAHCQELEAAGQPVFCSMTGLYDDIGGEIFRWEFVTAVVGAALRINPFDEPDVGLSKSTTSSLLAGDDIAGQEMLVPCIQEGTLSLVGDPLKFQGLASISLGLRYLLANVTVGDYVAILAWLSESEQLQEKLLQVVTLMRKNLTVPVTLGFGPRYLHSTGQLHKGGPNTGIFLQITSDVSVDLMIPNHDHTFGDLQRTQADSDLVVLGNLGRRAVRIDLGPDPIVGLSAFLQALKDALTG